MQKLLALPPPKVAATSSTEEKLNSLRLDELNKIEILNSTQLDYLLVLLNKCNYNILLQKIVYAQVKNLFAELSQTFTEPTFNNLGFYQNVLLKLIDNLYELKSSVIESEKSQLNTYKNQRLELAKSQHIYPQNQFKDAWINSTQRFFNLLNLQPQIEVILSPDAFIKLDAPL